jgi:hypothetical protein
MINALQLKAITAAPLPAAASLLALAAAFCRTSAFAVPCSQLKTLKEGFFKQCAAANVKVISE